MGAHHMSYSLDKLDIKMCTNNWYCIAYQMSMGRTDHNIYVLICHIINTSNNLPMCNSSGNQRIISISTNGLILFNCSLIENTFSNQPELNWILFLAYERIRCHLARCHSIWIARTALNCRNCAWIASINSYGSYYIYLSYVGRAFNWIALIRPLLNLYSNVINQIEHCYCCFFFFCVAPLFTSPLFTLTCAKTNWKMKNNYAIRFFFAEHKIHCQQMQQNAAHVSMINA